MVCHRQSPRAQPQKRHFYSNATLTKTIALIWRSERKRVSVLLPSRSFAWFLFCRFSLVRNFRLRNSSRLRNPGRHRDPSCRSKFGSPSETLDHFTKAPSLVRGRGSQESSRRSEQARVRCAKRTNAKNERARTRVAVLLFGPVGFAPTNAKNLE